MTAEDDAFTRTIVDSPGHDLPRLVYADWLDDRNDPRGPFLRAEVEWAQPWKDGQRPGDATELRAMAAGLDPLWVARVARPPVGVCCDHLRFEGSGPVLRRKDVDEIDRWPGVKLPVEYKAFLLNHNGGVPHRASHLSEVPRRVGSSYFDAIFLYPVIPPGDRNADDTLHGEVQRYWDDALPARMEVAASVVAAAENEAELEGYDERWDEKVMPVGRFTLAGGEWMLGIHRRLHPLMFLSIRSRSTHLPDLFCLLQGRSE